MQTLTISGIVKPGYQVASGSSLHSPYPKGTIEMQMPFFKKRGLDLSSFFYGTLNVFIFPKNQKIKGFKIIKPDFYFPLLEWIPQKKIESFSFVSGNIKYQDVLYPCYLYFPHPKTKETHFQEPKIMEILAPKINKISYHQNIELQFAGDKILLVS